MTDNGHEVTGAAPANATSVDERARATAVREMLGLMENYRG